MDEHDAILIIELAARTDATLLIPRFSKAMDDRRRQTEAIQNYWQRGLPWIASGHDRRAEQQVRERLAAEGLIAIHGGGGGRGLGVRLTPEGDDLARRMIGVATRDEALPLLDKVWASRFDKAGFDTAGWPEGDTWHWAKEDTLANHPAHVQPNGILSVLAEDFCVLLSRGLGVSQVDGAGHRWFAATAEGNRLAEARESEGVIAQWAASLAESELYPVYFEARERAVAAILSARVAKPCQLPFVWVSTAPLGVGVRATNARPL